MAYDYKTIDTSTLSGLRTAERALALRSAVGDEAFRQLQSACEDY